MKVILIVLEFEFYFNEIDMFLGFNEDIFLFLVFYFNKDKLMKKYKFIDLCKEELMLIVILDGVL